MDLLFMRWNKNGYRNKNKTVPILMRVYVYAVHKVRYNGREKDT